jgi:hypothetical protein
LRIMFLQSQQAKKKRRKMKMKNIPAKSLTTLHLADRSHFLKV